MVPGTFSDHPEPQLVGVAARDLEKAVVRHAGRFEKVSPVLPQEIGHKGRLAYEAGAILRRLLQQGTGLRP
jgi:hypothetical protein